MVYVGGQAGAGGAKIVFGEIPVTTSPADNIAVTLGGTPKYLSVIPKQTDQKQGTNALPCAFANPVIGDEAYINAQDNSGSTSSLKITITATGFTARSPSNKANTVPFGYLAIM